MCSCLAPYLPTSFPKFCMDIFWRWSRIFVNHQFPYMEAYQVHCFTRAWAIFFKENTQRSHSYVQSRRYLTPTYITVLAFWLHPHSVCFNSPLHHLAVPLYFCICFHDIIPPWIPPPTHRHTPPSLSPLSFFLYIPCPVVFLCVWVSGSCLAQLPSYKREPIVTMAWQVACVCSSLSVLLCTHYKQHGGMAEEQMRETTLVIEPWLCLLKLSEKCLTGEVKVKKKKETQTANWSTCSLSRRQTPNVFLYGVVLLPMCEQCVCVCFFR